MGPGCEPRISPPSAPADPGQGPGHLAEGLDPNASYALLDRHGLPIECPVCGAVARWRPLGQPAAFVCAHPARGSAWCLDWRSAAPLHAEEAPSASWLTPLGWLVARAPWRTWLRDDMPPPLAP